MAVLSVGVHNVGVHDVGVHVVGVRRVGIHCTGVYAVGTVGQNILVQVTVSYYTAESFYAHDSYFTMTLPKTTFKDDLFRIQLLTLLHLARDSLYIIIIAEKVSAYEHSNFK